MNLYFIHVFEDSDLDWFVIARDPASAIQLWKKNEIVKEQLEPGAAFKVRLVPASPGRFDSTPRLLDWAHDLKDVTP